MERHSRGVTQVCGVLCLLYGYAVEAVLFIAIVDGGIDTLQRQSGRIGLPEHITSMLSFKHTTQGSGLCVQTLSRSDGWSLLL